MPKTKDSRPENFEVRVRRVETWLARAEKERRSRDRDVAFLLYWIAFNAAYARDPSSGGAPATRQAIEDYFRDLLRVDLPGIIRETISNKCRHYIHTIVDIEHLFDPYWDYANELPKNYDWYEHFSRDRTFTRGALQSEKRSDTPKMLRIVFGRLCTLRNQLVHGGARHRSDNNRDSVRTGMPIMASLVPIFLRIMQAHHDKDWGQPYYRPGLQGKDEPSIHRHPWLQWDEDDGS